MKLFYYFYMVENYRVLEIQGLFIIDIEISVNVFTKPQIVLDEFEW